MSVTETFRGRRGWRPLRLATLMRLRWLAIAGQTVSVVFVWLWIGFPLPLFACLALIAMSAALNLWLNWRLGHGMRLSNRNAALQLAYDCLQLGALLWLTGGLENPFALLLLAPVSVSATTLTERTTLLVAILAVVIASVLAIWHMPLPWYPAAPLEFDSLYLAGIWASILLGVGFVATYTNRVAHEARQLADAVAATELTLSRQQELSALDGLAAAAAHELGTPLSTIALAAKEMRAELGTGPLAEDAELIIEQAARCKAILGKLRSLQRDGGSPFDSTPLRELVAEVVKPLEGLGKAIRISEGQCEGAEPVVARNVGLLFGLGNLIENAVHFAARAVEIELDWSRQSARIVITDDGPGFAPELIADLGEPYLTTRPQNAGTDPDMQGGLGLGIFIAKTLLEREGARLSFSNAHVGGHARVEVSWPDGFDAP